MAADVLVYRLYRLRRLILVSAMAPVLVVLALAALKGPWAFVLLPLALGVPLAHLLRYPNAWMETLAVSLVLAVLLALAGTVGPDIGLPGLALRLAGLGGLGVLLFLAASRMIPALAEIGPERRVTVQARRRTRLAPGEVKPRITLHPGREDGHISCGAADPEGTFPVVIRHRMPTLGPGGPEEIELLLYAQVLATSDTSHEVMSVEAGPVEPGPDPCTGEGGAADADAAAEAPPVVTVTRHAFRPARSGTIVEVAETGGGLTPFNSFGFWVQDTMADHLTDEIDRAEGRSPRANRFAARDQLLFDLARRVTARPPAQHPAE